MNHLISMALLNELVDLSTNNPSPLSRDARIEILSLAKRIAQRAQYTAKKIGNDDLERISIETIENIEYFLGMVK